MRILYVIDSLAPGGAETSLVELAPALVARGIDLHILPLSTRRDLAPSLDEAGARVVTMQTPGGRIANVRTVLAAAKDLKPDLVHTTLFEADVAGRTAAWMAGVPASTSLVGDTYGPSRREEVDFHRLRLALALDRLTARRASRFHAVSESLGSSGARTLRVPRNRIEVIPRGRNPQRFPFRPNGVRTTVRDSLGIRADAPVILTVGRLEPVKGLIHLMRSLPQMASAHPDLVVLMAGKDGGSSRELRTAAEGLRADIRFLGHRTDVASLLAAADVLCFPSLREGSPGALIEAMAVGCPVIASDIPPNREVLGTGDRCVGRLVRAADHNHLGDTLLRALADPLTTRELALRGRARFETLFTIDVVAPRMHHFFHAAAAARQAGPALRRRAGSS